MCQRVGRMGLISVDGPGQKNPDRSESPWGGVGPPLQGGTSRSRRPGTERIIRSPLRATVLPDCGGRSAMVVPTATTAQVPTWRPVGRVAGVPVKWMFRGREREPTYHDRRGGNKGGGGCGCGCVLP